MSGYLRSRSNLFTEKDFHWRGTELSRIEAFSDAVFAFAITLLVVSLEVPRSFDELTHVLRGFPAFAVCFAQLILVWHHHAKFFRRYGLQDAMTVALNSALLFLVLFFVYPLKFLFTLLLVPHQQSMINQEQVPALMVTYGLGFACVFGLFALLYLHAYRKREDLELDRIEVFQTRLGIIDCLGTMSFGLLSALIASVLPPRLAGLGGYVYVFIGFFHWWSGAHYGRLLRILAAEAARDKLQTSETAALTSTPSGP